ncbi:MAG: AAA family ATPase [Sulfuricurvum sp.]|nr:AAA family ATPase [Sulfuricurvum sp.]
MELVYLWVKNYKNIKEDGFNFSGRYRCNDYDPKLKKLTLNEKKDYIHIFPKNINVTAIVGENGSGKSAILHKLYEQKHTFFVDLTGKMIDDKDINKVLIEPNEFNQNSYDFEILYFANEAKKSNFFLHSFLPNTVYWNLSNKYSIDGLYHLNFLNANYSFSELPYNEFSQEDITSIETLFSETIERAFQNLVSTGNFTDYAYCKYFIQTISKISKYDMKNNLYETSYNQDQDEIVDHIQEDGAYIRLLIDIIVVRNNYVENFIEEIKEIVNEYNKDLPEIITLLNNLYNISQKKEMNVYTAINNSSYEYLDKIFKIEMYDLIYFKFLRKDQNKKIWLKDLSKGEQDFLKLFAIIFYHKSTVKYNFLLVLLDEVIVYWHPRWQREFLKRLIDFYNDTMSNLTIHTIITTHSPFILSDLSKENIIFLKDGKQVYPDIDTFGANIHTLLSHGFFMKEGLMGEFANKKINDAITLLNGKTLTDKEMEFCENIISIIGEPILKKQLQRMLDRNKIDYLAKDTKEEIEFLKHRIDLLSKRL